MKPPPRACRKTALIFGERHLTYAELNDAADRVAHRLIEAGVNAGDMVGLWHPRGIELLVLQLGIAKTGAAWLPFDADVPTDRIAVCLDDASAKALLISELLTHAVQAQEGISAQILTADALLAPLPEGTALRRREGALPEHTAYVIYTSGSTGKPKGIAITQGSISHFLRSENARLGVREDDKVYQGFSVAFDMSFEEIWISYLVGATLWIAPKEIAGDPEALPRALIENDVTVLHAVPRCWRCSRKTCRACASSTWAARCARRRWSTNGPRRRARCSIPTARPRPRCRRRSLS